MVSGGGPYSLGSDTNRVVKIPGSMNKPVIKNTQFQVMRSDKINESDPGTKVDNLYALTKRAVPEPI
jgi:hypothetical protein